MPKQDRSLLRKTVDRHPETGPGRLEKIATCPNEKTIEAGAGTVNKV